MQKSKSNIVELVLCITLGWAGGHKFYKKKIGMGILYLLTYGLFGIGWLVDTILIIIRMVKSSKPSESTPIPSETLTEPDPYDLPQVIPAEDNHTAALEDTSSIPALPLAAVPETRSEPVTDTTATVEPAPTKKPEYKEKTYKVTGMQHRMDNIMCLADENTDYDMSKKELIESGLVNERVWKYQFFPTKVELVPEPTNPHDPNAIMVVVDDEHVGYIKSGSCAHLLKVIKEDRILDITCEMGGGAYKYVAEDYDFEKDKEVYTLDRDTCPYFVHLSISEAIPQK